MIDGLKSLLPVPLRRKISDRLSRVLKNYGYVRFNARRDYAEDGLFTVHNQSFRTDPRFREAYNRGVQASAGIDPHFEWRVHVALWCAATALRVPGDFVECGVNAGFVSSAIMQSLHWESLPRTYYLVDTFSGPVVEQLSPEEIVIGRKDVILNCLAAGAYVTDISRPRANFAEWPNAVVVQGAIPDILPEIPAGNLAFLHLDTNCAAPECAALRYFWEKLSPGAIVLMDDYAHRHCEAQKDAIDEVARELGVQVLGLPTGQGLIIA